MKRLLLLLICFAVCFGSLSFGFSSFAVYNELGDVDGDGYVDNTDAITILKYDAGIIDLSASQVVAADVNKDDYADNTDAIMVLKYDAGIIDSFDDNGASDNGNVYHEMLPEPIDMYGREFNILQRWFGYGKETIDFQGEVIWDESEENGSMSNINLAKKKALQAVQKDYNCTIVGEMSTDTAGVIRTYNRFLL